MAGHMHALLAANETLLSDIRAQLQILRRRRDALQSQQTIVGVIIGVTSNHDQSGSQQEWSRWGQTGCGLGYDGSRQLSSEVGADEGSSHTVLGSGSAMLTCNLFRPIRHVEDPFSDVFRGVPPSYRLGGSVKLEFMKKTVQCVGPKNCDEREVSPILEHFPPPGNRVQWTASLDALLITLVKQHGLEESLQGSAAQWSDVARQLEMRLAKDYLPSIGGDFGKSAVPISAGCCTTRWFQMLLPMASYNASRAACSAKGTARLLTTVEYGSSSNVVWPQSHDEFIVNAVIENKCITGRLFWLHLAREPLLQCHSIFSIFARFQQHLNPLLCLEKIPKPLFRSLTDAMREGGFPFRHLGYSTKRLRTSEGYTWSPEEISLISTIRRSTTDGARQHCIYLTGCYRAAKRLGLEPPTLVLCTRSSIVTRQRDQLRSRMRYDLIEESDRKGRSAHTVNAPRNDLQEVGGSHATGQRTASELSLALGAPCAQRNSL